MYIETPRLILRSFSPTDEQALIAMASDGSLSDIFGDCSGCRIWMKDFLKEASELELADNPGQAYLSYAVQEKAGGRLVGAVGCSYYEDFKKTGVTYFLDAAYRKNGYMAEALTVYAEYFFARYDISELIAVIREENISSWKTVEKCGFSLTEKRMYKDLYDAKEALYRFYRLPYADWQAYLDLKNWMTETADVPLEGMDAFFDTRIEEYEAHMFPWREHYQWMASLLPENIECLLDVGCGSGLELDRIFARFPKLSVTGIDLSGQMLKKLSAKHGDKALILIQADYFTYDFCRESCFDAAVSFETLHHVPFEKKKQLFSKIRRSLKPGGVYLECDYTARNQAIEALCFAECRRRRRRDNIPPETFVHFDTPLTLEHELQALREAGFSEAKLVGYLPGDDHTPMIRALR